MSNPYKTLPDRAFWKPAVAQKNTFEIDGLWHPKFMIHPSHKVVTFGSCFAQHIGHALAERGFCWTNMEPPPPGLSPEDCKEYNYGIFSARTGNIYTTSLLLQWTEWALDGKTPPEEFWEKDGRVYDPFRPAIEAGGFQDVEEARQSRASAIRAFRRCIEEADCFVFTLGLTESWFNSARGYEYPMCPGTVAGEFDESVHVFRNQQFAFIFKNLKIAIEKMRQVNPKLRFLLTVSPVPLTATNSGNHVLVATMESKSILRAVAAQMSSTYKFIDYFPSYEIINSPVFGGVFFEPNQRNVSAYGVNFVMDSFFKCLRARFGAKIEVKKPDTARALKKQDEVCEEELLSAFGGGKQ